MPASNTHPESTPRPAVTGRVDLLRRHSFLVLLLCLAAFGMAAAVAVNVFDGMPHLEDEHANFFQAMIFAQGEIAAPAPLYRDSFFIPFTVIRNGIWFGKYTPGYPLILALGILAGAPWIVNALASALALAGVFLLGRDLFDAQAGLLAAALGAVSPAFVILSGSLLPHPVVMAALIFFAWACIRARRAGEAHPARFSLLAGVALGLAVLARPWTALAIATPFIAMALYDLLRDFRRGLRIYFVLGVMCAAVCALLPLYNYAVTGSPFTNTYTLWWPYDTVGFGPAVGREGGHTIVLGLLNARLDLAAFQVALAGWPAPFGIPLVAVPLIFGLFLAPWKKADFLLLLPPALLIAAHLAYWARAGSYYGGRYYSEAMPFLWLLAARGLLKFSAGKWRLRLVKIVLPVLLIWNITFQIVPRFAQGHDLYNISREGPDLIAAADLHHALVFVRIRFWTDYANFSWLNSPFLNGDVVYVRDMGRLMNEDVIQRYPGREVFLYDRYQPERPLMPYE